MKKFKLRSPSGEWMVTMATSIARARSNFAWRLRKLGMYDTDARDWAADTAEVET